MPFPNFEGKHAHDAFFTPHDFVAFLRRHGRWLDFTAPSGVVLCYQASLLAHVLETEEVERVKTGWGGEFCLLKRTANRVGVCGGFGIGAPIAAAVVEELIALGTTAFVNIGTAGGLQSGCRISDVVVCTEAIRDEGVSHHYLAPAPRAHPTDALSVRLKAALRRADLPHVEGPTWTIRPDLDDRRAVPRNGRGSAALPTPRRADGRDGSGGGLRGRRLP